jgi:hypothetical protein
MVSLLAATTSIVARDMPGDLSGPIPLAANRAQASQYSSVLAVLAVKVVKAVQSWGNRWGGRPWG